MITKKRPVGFLPPSKPPTAAAAPLFGRAYLFAVSCALRAKREPAGQLLGDGDYVAKSGTITFKPGETTKTITIVVNGDSKKEADETFYLDLFGLSSNSLFTKRRGIGTILNDD